LTEKKNVSSLVARSRRVGPPPPSVIGTMIGTGIFLKGPAENGPAKGRSGLRLCSPAWIIGAILSIFGAFSLRRIGFHDSRKPAANTLISRRAFRASLWLSSLGWMHSIVGPPQLPRLHLRRHDALS